MPFIYLVSGVLSECDIMQIDPSVWKLREELKRGLQLDKKYVLAVSGGADSMALADAAADVFGEAKSQLLVCHVEHGIRGAEALADAEAVRQFCAARGLSYICRHVDAVGYAEKDGLSLEEAARKLRYGELAKLQQSFGAVGVVTAHQADDQAETILWKLLRGAGTDGLSGMQQQSEQEGLTVIRPLLYLTRADIEAYCKERQLQYCQDSTNDDLAYTRNRIRRELLPYLEEHFNPAIKDALVREAQLLAEDQQCLEALAEQYLQDKSFCEEFAEGYSLNAAKLIGLPTALRKRILRKLYFCLGGKELSYERTLALENLCLQGTGGKIIQLPGTFQAVYKKKKLYLTRC